MALVAAAFVHISGRSQALTHIHPHRRDAFMHVRTGGERFTESDAFTHTHAVSRARSRPNE